MFSTENILSRHKAENHQQVALKRPQDSAATRPDLKKRRLAHKDDPEEFYDIQKVKETHMEKFKTKATYYKVSFRNLEIENMSEILKTLRILFQSIIDNLTLSMEPSDLVRLSIDNQELDFPISLPFMRRSALTVDRILSEIERVLQSYEQFVLDESLGIELIHVHLPGGGVSKRKPYVDLEKLLKDKTSVIRIQNTDEMCLARALVVAVARIVKDPQWNNIRQGRAIQKTMAINLHHRAGVPLGKCGIAEIKLFQNALPNYQINVLSKDHFNAIIYSGPEGGIPIYIYHHDQHFDVISRISGFLNRNFFCLKCKNGYDHMETHRCNNPCIYCHHIHEFKSEKWIYCRDCHRHLQNGVCFELHKRQTKLGKSTCEKYFKCNKCDQTINMKYHKNQHVCGENYCKVCKDFFQEDHRCYMQPTDSEKSDNQRQATLKYIFFDFECTQDILLQCSEGFKPGADTKCINCKTSWCGSFEHKPNFCVAQRTCEKCLNFPITPESICKICGNNEHVFYGMNTTENFCRWLFSEENYGATVICHNFKGYDSYPVLKYLHENAILPKVITTGSKFMSIEIDVCNMRFIDSLNFIPMALADMPKAFGETELAKGYFPHLFNRTENQSVILPQLPDMKYYNPDGMKPKSREMFLSWYSKHENDSFDFQTELLHYCRSDVDILRRCCLRFRSLFMQVTKTDCNMGIDPFERCITIASACNLVFRSNFLEEGSIEIIPPHGYRPTEKQSFMAYQWMSYLSTKENIEIQHGRNVGEKQIGPFKVDGYYETAQKEKVVLEFHGCF